MYKPKKIGVMGAGYVGLIKAVGFAEIKNKVICYDIDSIKIEKLKKGFLPIYEENLQLLLDSNLKEKNLIFTDSIKDVVENSEYLFIAVGTPSNEDGTANLEYLFNCLKDIARYMNNYKIIIIKSTVLPGTCKKASDYLKNQLELYGKNIDFDVVSNPEFLREGNAIYDFFYPDRIIIGTDNERARLAMKDLYKFFIDKDFPVLFTNHESSELIKLSSNAFLATKISFINELSRISEKVGANIKDISKGMGLDKRIGEKFLEAGPGYGGSCFPKDTKALYYFAKENNITLKIVESAIKTNEDQIKYSVSKIIKAMSPIEGKTLTVLGLTFKPNTDDIRESPSIYIIKELIAAKAIIQAYCFKGIPKARSFFVGEKNIKFCEDVYDSLKDSEACIIATDWQQFKNIDFDMMQQLMKENNLFDLRNIYYDNPRVKEMFNYFGLGVKTKVSEVFI